MNIQHLLHLKYAQNKKIDPRVFWQWCVIGFIGAFCVVTLYAVFLFRSTQQFIDTPMTVGVSNTDDVVARLSKRVTAVQNAVQTRTGISTIGDTSQN